MACKHVACWMSDKKIQKINWDEFEKAFKQRGLRLFKLDLNRNIQEQGDFCVLLHKLTDIIASADQGDPVCMGLIKNIERHLIQNPNIIVIDPIPNLRRLLNRYISYCKIETITSTNSKIFIPSFCELLSSDVEDITSCLSSAGVTYPFICKPTLGHGSRQAHEMLLIFNEKGLKDCRPPCVAQSFVTHNAVLYKIFIVGEKYHYVERPSLKNFQASDHEETIYFDSSDVSKAGATSSLTLLDPDEDVVNHCDKIDATVFDLITTTLRGAFGMDLLGVDVVIEKSSGKYGIIDVNAYPGYDGFPDFFDVLVDTIVNKIINNSNKAKFSDKNDKLCSKIIDSTISKIDCKE